MMRNENGQQDSILVVEDEPILGKVCQRILEAAGYVVTLTINGLSAKSQLEQKQFDFCLSDIKTPVMNGMELFLYIKKNYPELSGKMIFMTGDVMSKDIQQFLEKNDAPYILKPFTNSQLLTAIKNLGAVPDVS